MLVLDGTHLNKVALNAILCESSLIDDLLNIDEYYFLLCFLCSYNLKCAILEVIVKIEQSQKLNLHLLHNNVILSHSCTINIAKFISVAVHIEILFLFIKVPEILSLKLFLS